MTTNTDAVPLPCPMCNATLSGASASGYHYHPANGCIFSGFEVSRDDISAWNRRHPDVPTADDGEIWPSATVIVDEQGNVTSAKLYAPGLPAGRHDLFPVRVPYMDEHTEAWLAVSNTLRAIDPDYLNGHGNAIEQAVAAIRKLAALATPAAQAADLSNEDASLIERLKLLASGDGMLIKSEFANTTISRAIQRLAASHPSAPATQADHIADERKMVEGEEPLPQSAMPAWRDVVRERRRQIGEEGWTPEHDDKHDAGEMAAAASAYALAASDEIYPLSQGDGNYRLSPPDMWMWAHKWWKPTTPRRNLVKAGALILAEIERIDRAASSTGKQA